MDIFNNDYLTPAISDDSTDTSGSKPSSGSTDNGRKDGSSNWFQITSDVANLGVGIFSSIYNTVKGNNTANGNASVSTSGNSSNGNKKKWLIIGGSAAAVATVVVLIIVFSKKNK